MFFGKIPVETSFYFLFLQIVFCLWKNYLVFHESLDVNTKLLKGLVCIPVIYLEDSEMKYSKKNLILKLNAFLCNFFFFSLTIMAKVIHITMIKSKILP